MAYTVTHFEDLLPWSDTESDRRFVGFVIVTVFVTLLSFILLRFVPITLPEIKHDDQLTHPIKVQIPKRQLPKPPPPKPKPVEKPKAQTPPKPTPKKPEPKPVPKPKKPEPTAEQRAEAARKKAANSGLVAMQDELSNLRQSFDTNTIKNQQMLRDGGVASKTPTDNTAAVIASRAGKGSGGINTSTLGRSTGGEGLAGRNTSAVVSGIKNTRGGNSASSARSRGQEEIELMFQKNRGAIDIIYNRALRTNPGLRGKLVLEITIASNGNVINVRILSSELKDTELENKIIARVKLFKFEAHNNIDTTTVRYPIDFLPS